MRTTQTHRAPLEPDRMRLSDLDEVVAIEAASFPTPWSRNLFLAEMANESARPVVFRRAGKVVGYLCFWKVVDEAHLLNIAVAPHERGRGVGTWMMDFLERLCRDEGLRNIILDVARRNEPARALYRRCGFQTIGFRRKYYSAVDDDALIMEKVLDRAPDSPIPSDEEGSP